MSQPIKKVLIDLDGVMADWIGFVSSQPEYTFSSGDEFNKSPDRSQVCEAIYGRYPDLFNRLGYLSQFTEILDTILSHDVDVAWATSCGPYGEFETNKHWKTVWLDRVIYDLYHVKRNDIGEIHFFRHGECKSEMAAPDVLLIDDFKKNTDAFSSAGGQTVLVNENGYQTGDVLPLVEKALGIY